MIVFCSSILMSLQSHVWAGDPLKISVSIVPQKYFVEKIGKEFVDVSVMVRPGASPATYEPRPQQMVDLIKSRIYFAIGVPFEKVWVEKFIHINPKMIIAHTQDGIEKIPMKGTRYHNHPPHNDRIKDPHVWLSPPLVMIQARNILNTLLRVDPVHKRGYEKNYSSFMGELIDLDLQLLNLFMNQGERTRFMVYHPSWGYFAKAYGLEQIPIEMEGKEPTPKALRDLVDRAKKLRVKAIFVQPQFSIKTAKTIADAIGCQITYADPLAFNWAENLIKVAENLQAGLR